MVTSLSNRQIVLGITGGIAAYKSAELVRRLQDAGAAVRVVMTPAAREFITPLTFQALSGFPVHLDLLDPEAEAGMGHIQLARWADAVVIAPASADFLAKLAQGRGDDLLTTICLATQAPLLVAPAMNQAMWANTATQDNVSILRERRIQFVGPDAGSQACGDIGPGRMAEVPALVEATAALFESRLLDGVHALVTAGPTREAIDPVRYISNHSSGKMGFAIARALADAGAITTLVSGPVGLATPPRVRRVDVMTAQEMHSAVMAELAGCQLFVGTAAVADFRPATVAAQKIKKEQQASPVIELVRNPDIIADVAKQSPRPFVVGFAAETESLDDNAEAKRCRKQLDMIVANDVSRGDIGFNHDDNAVTVFWQGGQQVFEKTGKSQLAAALVKLFARAMPKTE